jgi:predicted GNAT family acetyltransferase
MNSIDIQHDPEAQRFYTILDGKEAYLAYSTRGEGVLDYRHTFVPPELRGRQVAKLLVAEAFAYARESGFKVVPTCSYVAKQVERNSEYAELTVGQVQ